MLGLFGKVIAEIVELRLLLNEVYLIIADGGAVLGIPVYHAFAAVDEPFGIEVVENLVYALAAEGVHGEGSALPVARGAEFAELLEDNAAVFLGPVPSVAEELLSGKVGFLDTLRGKFGDNLGLGRNRGVVSAGYPEGVLALHACAANEDILNCIVKHVTHVEHTGHVWRGNDYSIRFACVGLAMKELVFKPICIPFVFNLGRVVFLWQFVHLILLI